MSDITVLALQEKVDAWSGIKKEIAVLEHEISRLNERLNPIARELVEIMEALELEKFEGAEGKIRVQTVNYVNNPATEADKAAFNQYLRDEGIFDSMVSVHHQKLNSFYKMKLEEAIEKGEPLYIPGLEAKQRKEIRKGR